MLNKKVLIEQVRPDPKQPRKIFNEEYVRGLSESLKVEGMINPIEVDSNLQILTGECRWRAAKLAGWKEVPVNINETEMPEYERFRHQLAENLHQSGEGSPMNPQDVALSFKKMLKMKGHLVTATRSKGVDEGISELARELGISERKIRTYLDLLEEPAFVLESITKDSSKFSSFDEAKRVPEKYRKDVQKAIADGKVGGKLAVRRFASLAKVRPDKAELELLRITQKQNIEANKILNRAIELGLALGSANPEKFTDQDRQMVILQLGSTSSSIREFLGRLKK